MKHWRPPRLRAFGRGRRKRNMHGRIAAVVLILWVMLMMWNVVIFLWMIIWRWACWYYRDLHGLCFDVKAVMTLSRFAAMSLKCRIGINFKKKNDFSVGFIQWWIYNQLREIFKEPDCWVLFYVYKTILACKIMSYIAYLVILCVTFTEMSRPSSMRNSIWFTITNISSYFWKRIF